MSGRGGNWQGFGAVTWVLRCERRITAELGGCKGEAKFFLF